MKNKKQTCTVCGKDKKNLDEHMRICHADVVVPPPAAAPLLPAPVPPRVRKPAGKGSFYLLLGIIFAVFGAGSFAIYIFTLNMMFGYLFIPPLGLAWFCFYKFKKSRDYTAEVIYTTHLIPKKQVNSMNLYPRTNTDKRGVVFEDMTEPQGQPWVCDNDGKPYFIHIKHGELLEEFQLPDEQYYEPHVYAERVLGLPAHRRIFMRKQTLLQKLSPYLLILVIGAEWLIIITTTAPKA